MRVALVDQVGTGSGVGSFLRGLVAGLLAEAPEPEWRFGVHLPARDYAGKTVEWPAELAGANLDVHISGDATGQVDGTAWIEGELAGGDYDAAYFAYPYLASCPDLAMPVIATTHDFNHKRFDTWSADLRATVERQLQGWMRRADVVVVSSHFIAAELGAYYPEAAPRARVVRLGVPAAAAGEHAGADVPAAPYLLTVGWVARHKNQALIFRALGRLRQEGLRVRLLLVGPNADEVDPTRARRQSYAWHLVRLAEAAGLEPGTDYAGLGYVDRPVLEALYRGAVALVMPTLYEAGSFPVREALRLGCPAICADIPALAEDVGLVGGGAQLVDPLDPEELASAIRQAVEEAAAQRAAAARAGASVEEVFDWRRTARGYLAAFQAAAAAGRAACWRRWPSSTTPV